MSGAVLSLAAPPAAGETTPSGAVAAGPVATRARALGGANLATNAWAACLGRLIDQIEPGCPPDRLLSALPAATDRFDKLALLNTMAHLGYAARAVETPLDEVDRRLLPALFVPRNGAPLLIVEDGEGAGASIAYLAAFGAAPLAHSPAGTMRGTLWIFERYDEHRQPTSRFMRAATELSWFAALLGRFRTSYLQIVIAGVMLNVVGLGTPLFVMLVYDRVVATSSAAALPMLALGAVITVTFEWWMRSIRSLGLSWFAGRLDNIVGNKIFAHLLALPPQLIERATVAGQVARVKTFETVRDFVSSSAFIAVVELPFIVVALVAMAVIAGPLALVPVVGIGFYIALFLVVRTLTKPAIRIAAKASSARQQFTIETVEKLAAIRIHGLTAKWLEKFRSLSGREVMAQLRLNWLGLVAENLAQSLTTLTAASTVLVGVVMVWNGSISAGALVASVLLVWRLLTPFYALCAIIPRLEQVRNSVLQVNDLVEIESEAEAPAMARLPKLSGAVVFDKVSAKDAASGEPVFRDLSFTAAPGDMVAVTGPSGAGRSLVLHLVKALRNPTAGTVQIDGFDLRQLHAPSLRRQIGYVPRNPDLFHGSVADNLRLGAPFATDDELWRALIDAAAAEDVDALDEGLATVIGNRSGAVVSTSLAARIALARGYLHDGAILLIDVLPNSLLGGVAGANLKRFLAGAKGRRTVFHCTFRDDFMRLADTIVQLNGTEDPTVGGREMMLERMQQKAHAS